MNPFPLTLGELKTAADARRSAAWDVAAEILWHTYNSHCGEDALEFTSEIFHPFKRDKAAQEPAAAFHVPPAMTRALFGVRPNHDPSRLPEDDR